MIPIQAALRNAVGFVATLTGNDHPHDASEALSGSQAPIRPTPLRNPSNPSDHLPADTVWWENQADRIAERLAR